MRKLISFILVLALILGCVSMASAATFTDDSSEPVRLLSDLGVINGYGDGSFRGFSTISRAEFATMVVRALGFGTVSKSATTFDDVPTTHWASGYISVAHDLGIIYGKTTTKFDPEANITNNEAIAMVMRTLGYQEQYIMGSYPAAYINVAIGLGILNDLPTGGAAATRTMVATLLFNALGEDIVAYAGGTQVSTGDTLLERLGGQAYNNGQPFVVTGEESAVSTINLKDYIGSYVEAYADKRDGNKIIAISKVLSDTVTAKVSYVGTFGNMNNGTVGNYKVTSAVTSGAPFVYFVNGEVQANPTAAAINNNATYTLAVKLDGIYISQIYSAQLWTVSAVGQMTKSDIDAINENATLLTETFKTSSKDVIDTTSFALAGVSSLKDIKEDNVVTVYSNSKNIVKIEVGTAKVNGLVTQVNSDNKVIINNKLYAISTLPGSIGYVSAGTKGTFYLDYNGNIYSYAAEAVTSNYGIILAVENGDPSALNTINDNLAKVKLINSDGNTIIASINKNVADVNGYYTQSTRAFTGGATPAIIDQLVKFSLNSAGEIRELSVLSTSAIAANTKVSKNGTYDGYIITDNTIIFDGAAQNYSIIKKSAILDSTSANIGKIYVADPTSKVVSVMIINGVVEESQTLVVFDNWSEILSSYASYQVYGMTSEGNSIHYLYDGALSAVQFQKPVVYKFTIDAHDVITPTVATVTTTSAAIGVTKAALVNQGSVYTFTNNTDTYLLDTNTVVLVLENKTWTKKTLSVLNRLENATVTLIDTDTVSDDIYNFVLVQYN